MQYPSPRSKTILCAALGTALIGGPAHAAPRAARAAAPLPAAVVRQTLQGLYDAQDAALSAHAPQRAMAWYAPEYVAVGQDGVRHTRDEEFDALEKVGAMGQTLRQHSRIEKIITRGGQASLVLLQQTTMDLFNPNTHQALVLHTEGVRQDLWARTARGDWELTFSKTVLQRSSTGAGPVEATTPRPAPGVHAPKSDARAATNGGQARWSRV